jgi:hypothetical protein
VVVAAPVRFEEHIDYLEASAALTSVRRLVSKPAAFGTRCIGWSDSQVVAASVNKGRSSSFPLLKRLRSIAALLLAHGTSLQLNWIPTALNPADEPSRRFANASPPVPARRQHGKAYSSNSLGDGPPWNFLAAAAYKPATFRRYAAAVGEFLDFVDDLGLPTNTVPELDRALECFFLDVYVANDGGRRSVAACAKSGIVMLLPQLQSERSLPRANRALKGWRNLVPSVSYPPLTWDLSVCIASVLAAAGFQSEAVAVLLAFDCYLRSGETVGLRVSDVADTGDIRLGSSFRGMALRLRKCKTGKNQWVTVKRPVVQRLLRSLMASRSPSDLVFGFDSPRFLARFKAACRILGLSADYVVHSLRHGGATADFLEGISVEDILLRGRWASTKSARIYIQSGRALLLAQQIPPKVERLIPVVTSDVFRSIFPVEPAVPRRKVTFLLNGRPIPTRDAARRPPAARKATVLLGGEPAPSSRGQSVSISPSPRVARSRSGPNAPVSAPIGSSPHGRARSSLSHLHVVYKGSLANPSKQ